MIRKAESKDIPQILRMLEQILLLHHKTRPDLFRGQGTKYDARELEQMLSRPQTPIFVYQQGDTVTGYIMCQEQNARGHVLQPVKTLYIDDLCVDESARGKGVGRKLMEYATDYARKNGFYNITLHVWEGNPGAMAFYRSAGLTTQYTSLELIVKD